MNKRQKEVQAVQLNDEQRTIRELKQVYKKASEDCADRIRQLSTRTDFENLQTIVYQKQYQEALKKQIDGVLDTLNGESFTTVAAYLEKSYDNGFFGTLYDLQGQGIPLVYPIDQEQIVAALQTDSKISQGLYKRMGEDTKHLKNSIRAELSRGITNGESWNGIAAKIASGMNSPFDKAYHRTCTIARTEGHRVQQTATYHCQQKAKSKGADVVKQWDSTLDGLTRPWHMDADGQVAEIDQPFEVMGEHLMFPSDPAGSGKNVINCRCCSLQRARWAISDEEYYTKFNGDSNELVKVQSKSYNDFRNEVKETILAQNGAEFTKKVEQCTTVQELNDYATDYFRQKQGCNVQVVSFRKDTDLDAAKHMVMKLDDLDNRFHSSCVSVKTTSLSASIGGKATPQAQGIINYCSSGNPADLMSDIEINATYVKSKKAILADHALNNVASGLALPQCAVIDADVADIYTLCHEYGHTVLAGKATELMLSNGGTNATYATIRRIYRQTEDAIKDLERQAHQAAQSVGFGYEGALEKANMARKPFNEKIKEICVSKYSRASCGEFIAECFAEAELSNNPHPVAVKVHDLLVKAYGK